MGLMLEALIPTFLAQDVGARVQIRTLRRDSEADGGIAWQVEAHQGRRSIGCSTVSTDLDAAIFATLRTVGFEPTEVDCSCDHAIGLGFVDDSCVYHDWMRRVRNSEEDSRG
jgi:hypothetical protein